MREGRLEEAEEAFRAACLERPEDAGVWHLLGYVLTLRQAHGAAIDALGKAASLAPGNAEILYNLASAYRAAGEPLRAIDAFEQSAHCRPDWFAPWASLADLNARQEAFDDAEEMYRRALEKAPELAELHFDYAKVLMQCRRIDEAIVHYRRAVELKPALMRAYSAMLCAMHYSDRYAPEEIRDAHFEFETRYAKALAPAREVRIEADADRPLRIGYVSPDFRRHAVGSLVAPALKHHDRARFTIYCYSDVARPDARTGVFRTYADRWRDIAGASDQRVAELVREDAIDILVDLTGHTDDHRLLVFARKPAPVQITWIGHPNTTGMRAMDYRITDAYADPPGATEYLHSERLLRLPEIYLPFELPEDAGASSPPPCLARGHVTFGSFNSALKLKDRMIEVWARILQAVPQSRLLMITLPQGRTQQRVIELFGEYGIAPDRLDLRGRLTHEAFLQAYAQVDVALDTFPYHGTTTTAYTLSMGVPVVTLAGSTHLSRVGVSMLSNVGLPDLVASSEQEYVARAAELACDRARLAQLRSTLRERMLAGPNANGARFARALEAAYRHSWEEHCRTHQ